MIDKLSPVPLYYQIMEDIRQSIREGRLLPGEKLPTEQWLCEHYDVSRVTIRKALAELTSSGQIQGFRGKGNYIATPNIQLSISHMASLHRALTGSGIIATSQILSIKNVSAPPVVAKNTELSSSTQMIEVHRIRYANGSPIAEQTIYLPEAFGEKLPLEKLDTDSLYDMFQRFGINIAYSNQSFMAIFADDAACRNLQLEGNRALLSIHATVYNTDNEIVEYSINNYVPDRYTYNIRLDYLSQ